MGIHARAMRDANRLLQSIKNGDPQAAGELLPLLYNELRRLAREKLAREAPGRLSMPRRWCMKPICG